MKFALYLIGLVVLTSSNSTNGIKHKQSKKGQSRLKEGEYRIKLFALVNTGIRPTALTSPFSTIKSGNSTNTKYNHVANTTIVDTSITFSIVTRKTDLTNTFLSNEITNLEQESKPVDNTTIIDQLVPLSIVTTETDLTNTFLSNKIKNLEQESKSVDNTTIIDQSVPLSIVATKMDHTNSRPSNKTTNIEQEPKPVTNTTIIDKSVRLSILTTNNTTKREPKSYTTLSQTTINPAKTVNKQPENVRTTIKPIKTKTKVPNNISLYPHRRRSNKGNEVEQVNGKKKPELKSRYPSQRHNYKRTYRTRTNRRHRKRPNYSRIQRNRQNRARRHRRHNHRSRRS